MPRKPPKRRSFLARIVSRLTTRTKPSGKLYRRRERTGKPGK